MAMDFITSRGKSLVNTKDRDDLLARLDERSRNTYRLVEKINNTVSEHTKNIQRNTTWINAFKWVISVIVTGVAVGLSKLQGWW